MNQTLKEKLSAGKYDFIIASHMYPCGASWLINVLLELDICVDFKTNVHENVIWDFINDHTAVTKKDPTKFQLNPLLAAVTAKKEKFSFKENCYFITTHDPIYTDDFYSKKVILYVRDPRDAIYSSYKNRFPDEKISFQELLKNDTIDNFIELSWFDPTLNFWLTTDEQLNFIQVFNITTRLALWTGLWLKSVPQENLLVIKFEDTKKEPFHQVEKVLNFINIKRTDEEIRIAIEESSFEKAKKQEISNYNGSSIRFRKGTPGEWKNAYTENDLKIFNGLPYIVMNSLGYCEGNPYNEYLESIEEITNNLKGFRTKKFDKLISFLEILEEQNNTYPENISEQFFLIYSEYFKIRKKLNPKMKFLIAKIYSALAMAKIFSSNSNKVDFINMKLSKAEILIFRTLIILFNKMSVNELKNVIAKVNFQQFSIPEFLS